MNILQSLELHGFAVRRHPNPRVQVWEVSAKGGRWVLALHNGRVLSPTGWLQSWIDSMEEGQ